MEMTSLCAVWKNKRERGKVLPLSTSQWSRLNGYILSRNRPPRLPFPTFFSSFFFLYRTLSKFGNSFTRVALCPRFFFHFAYSSSLLFVDARLAAPPIFTSIPLYILLMCIYLFICRWWQGQRKYSWAGCQRQRRWRTSKITSNNSAR